MHAIDRAIAQLQEEVDAYHQGTAQAPLEDSPEWFVLRAKSLGLSHLKRARQLGAHEKPAAAERFYRACSKTFKTLEVPDPVEVLREVAPHVTGPMVGGSPP
jgi:hypothetical protein